MRLLTLAISLALSSSVVHAQKLKPAITPGLWHSLHTTVVNGEDVHQTMHDMQQELIARQPVEQQEMMRAILAEDDPRTTKECLTEAAADAFLERKGFFDTIKTERYMQNCRVDREHFNLGTHRLEISCDPGSTIGIIGEGFIEKRIINPKHVLLIREFDGLNMIHETDDGELESIDFASESRGTDEMIWLGPDCGDLSADIHSE